MKRVNPSFPKPRNKALPTTGQAILEIPLSYPNPEVICSDEFPASYL